MLKIVRIQVFQGESKQAEKNVKGQKNVGLCKEQGRTDHDWGHTGDQGLWSRCKYPASDHRKTRK